jgi:hypothetical protein
MTDVTPADPIEPSRPDGTRRVLTRKGWTAVVAGAALVALGIWLVTTRLPVWLNGPPVDAPATTAAADARKIHVSLFYVSNDSTSLFAVSREVLYGATPAEQARRIAEAQVQTPPAGMVSAIPDGTTVRAVFVTDQHEAYVDLGGTIRTGHSGGSLDEALAVYAIVNALTVNLPDVTAVQILVDGQEVDTLAGHLDLRHPLAKDLTWIEKGQ